MITNHCEITMVEALSLIDIYLMRTIPRLSKNKKQQERNLL